MEQRRGKQADGRRRTRLIAGFVALALGIGVAWTMRAASRVGEGMIRSVDETRSPSRPIEGITTRAPTVEAGPNGSVIVEPSREPLALARIKGHVTLPPNVPPGEALSVALWSEFEGGAVVSRADVGSDGRFEFDAVGSARVARLGLDARYLYLEHDVPLGVGATTDAIELTPKLGARILGRCRLPAGRDDVRPFVVGRRVSAGIPGWPVGRVRTVEATVDDDLRFELHGVETRDEYVFGATCRECGPELRMATGKGPRPKLEPGQDLDITLDVVFRTTVAGTVLDEHGGPLAGVRCTSMSAADSGWNPRPIAGRSETGADGSFFLFDPPRPQGGEGQVSLAFERAGYLPALLPLGPMVDGERGSGLVVRMAPSRAITGRVVWADGTPAREAAICADPEAGSMHDMRVVRADQDGRFDFDALDEGQYVVSARAVESSDEDLDEPVEPVPAPRRGVVAVRHVVAGTKDLELKLGAGSALHGRFVDDRGAPYENFRVCARPVVGGESAWLPSREVANAFTSEDGRFELPGLYAGEWEVRGSIGLFRSVPEFVSVAADIADVGLSLPRRAALHGIVLDLEDHPVPFVDIFGPTVGDPTEQRLRGDTPARAARTDANGEFDIPEAWPGHMTVFALAWNGRASDKVELDLLPGSRAPDLTLHYLRPGSLQFEVVDTEGAPVRNATVEWMSAAGPTDPFASAWHSDRWDQVREIGPGLFELGPCDPCRILVRATDRPVLVSVRECEIRPEETTRLRLQLAPAVPYSLVLDDQGGGGVIQIRLTDAMGRLVERVLAYGTTGRLHQGVLIPGAYRIDIAAIDGRKITREVDLQGEDEVAVHVRFDP